MAYRGMDLDLAPPVLRPRTSRDVGIDAVALEVWVFARQSASPLGIQARRPHLGGRYSACVLQSCIRHGDGAWLPGGAPGASRTGADKGRRGGAHLGGARLSRRAAQARMCSPHSSEHAHEPAE